MLPAPLRLRRSSDFTSTVGTGVRAGRPRLVVHLALDSPDPAEPSPGPARAGFVVSKAVGGSVVRHRVTRRLRPLVAARLADVPAGARLVVRALPASATATSAELSRDLDAALVRARQRAAGASS